MLAANSKRRLRGSVMVSGIWLATSLAISCFVFVQPARATADIQGQTACSSGQTFSTVLTAGLPSGDIYVRLTGTNGHGSGVTLYYQPFTALTCMKLGSTEAGNVSWTKINSNFLADGQGGYLTIAGPGLDAGPYQAAADVLIVQGSVCQPAISCNVTYEGHSGILQPRQISGATDQISVHTVQPVNGVKLANVQYYSDATYLYTTKALTPIDANYLAGGKHQIQTFIQLANGESIEIDGVKDMGTDYTGILWLRSTFYRSSGAARVIIVAGAGIIAGAIILALARLVFKVHHWRQEHGLNSYKMRFTKPKSSVKVG